jgi:hypothetical protein
MKKIFSIFLCAAFVFALSADLFAKVKSRFITNDEFTGNSKIDFRPSNKVDVYYAVDSSVDNVTDLQKYMLATKHFGGDTAYGSLSADSNIYKNGPKDQYIGKGLESSGVSFPDPADNASDITWPDGWEKM